MKAFSNGETRREFRSHQRDEFEAALAEIGRAPGWRVCVDTDEDGERVVAFYFAPWDARP